ncbi:MATE family efflux transporter [Aureibacter tunicatorum]|uniref:Multidrug-efflux transporter n=1 Tax=Aureibacter tunicatorum TaxID=866807 RepID=A0AAE3XT01_9BACT|nr:MATE family efflux transporter [Aureibacter tunicatorum]MDR6241469.1 MATE family multidrug resistance protein [Aureibacter tunicatorum]BDD06688.1 MATE family efflux transporter [Aureibacter tunicatorum]
MFLVIRLPQCETSSVVAGHFMVKMNTKQHFTQNFKLAYPIMLSQFGQVMVTVVDTIMVGQVGTSSLAAASFSGGVFAVFMIFGMGITYVLSPLVAEANGSGRSDKAASYFKNSLLLYSSIGFLFFGLAFIVAQNLHVFGQSEAVTTLSKDYFLVLAASLLPLMFFQSFRQLAEGMQSTREAMFITIASNLLNIFFNWVLIFGHFGFEPMGLLGAGIATLISRIVMPIGMGIFVFKSPIFSKVIKHFGSVKISKKRIGTLLKLGTPTGTQALFEVGAFSFTSIMCGWVSDVAQAAHQIALNFGTIFYMIASGIGAAASASVGTFLGKKQILNAKKSGMVSMMMCVALTTFSCLVMLIFKNEIPKVYIDDPVVVSMAAQLLLLCGVFQIVDGVQVAAMGALRGLQDVKVPAIFIFIAYWILGIPSGYVLAFKFGWGSSGVWMGLVIGLTVVAVLSVIRFIKISDKKLRMTESMPISEPKLVEA